MKKQMSWVVIAAVLFGAVPAMAATRAASSVDLTGAPGTRTRTNVNYEKYETRTTSRTYNARDGKNMYYTQPVKRSELYKQYAAGNQSGTTVRTTRSETVRTELKRKYFLAHPFFQPLKGKFGSITDLSYNWNSYDVEFLPDAGVTISDPSATWETKQLSVKEDLSFGITDTVAILGMIKYDSSDYKLDWSLPITPDDAMDDNGLNLFGLGAQWRFIDNAEWIATASAYYQHQKDISNNFVLDLKAGYKVASSTIYGLARGWLVDFDGNSYGNAIEGQTDSGNKSTIFLAYDMDVDSVFYVEGGLGVFSVLDEDWTLNVEGLFGHYDWHNQFSIKGAIGWQPNDWMALNLYAKTSLYDSANDKTLQYWGYGYDADLDDGSTVYVPQWYKMGNASVDKYSETTVGLQAIFMF